ncbi:signal peptidase complex subunit 2-like isoform X2 [Silene latifolia]|uniref:signal peptidase complex subunit 2-like isoform X1 n=1 Tax=Silene latifolia TaxID=37657 RepID=UPI003D76AB90
MATDINNGGGDSTTTTNETAAKKQNPKKCNLLDHHAIKYLLDETVCEVVHRCGFPEDVRLSNMKLLMGSLIIILALVAQFYPKKFPDNRYFLIGCIVLYVILNVVLQLIIYKKQRNAIVFTHPPRGSSNVTGVVVSSTFPRFSDMYTLTIESADPNSISANKPVELTKSVTKWFTKDGVLVEGIFWNDVKGLLESHYKEPKKNS